MSIFLNRICVRLSPHNLLFLIVFCSTILLTLVTINRVEELTKLNFVSENREKVHTEIASLRRDIEGVLIAQSLVLRELAGAIRENPKISQDEFALRVQSLHKLDASAISVTASQNFLVSLIYPLVDNVSSLGSSYIENEKQRLAVLKKMQSGDDVLIGPVELIQGGVGLILKTPIYSLGSDIHGNVVKPWGMASIVFDYQKFIDKVGLTEAAKSYDLLLDFHVPSNETADKVFGNVAVNETDPVTLSFNLFKNSLFIHATPKDGWQTIPPTQKLERAIMVMIAVGFLLVFGYILRLARMCVRAETQLKDGIESLDHGFVMFDKNDRLLLNNEKFSQMYSFPEKLLKYGTPYAELVKSGILRELYLLTPDDVAKKVERRFQARLAGASLDHDQYLADGRVIKASERRMSDGSYVGLRVDTTELTHAKNAAEAASKAKSDFISLLSHELLTPMTVILGMAQLANDPRNLEASKTLLVALKIKKISPEETLFLLDKMFDELFYLTDRIAQSGDQLMNLINEMLDFAKNETGAHSINKKMWDIKSIVEPVAAQLRMLTIEKGLELEIIHDQGMILADKSRVQQILFNLTNNALKFTKYGYIRLQVKVTVDTVIFEVQDSGLGISKRNIGAIFEPFYQVDSTTTRSVGGAGIGLATSLNLANLFGGTLTVTSTLGVGSCFKLTLPLSER